MIIRISRIPSFVLLLALLPTPGCSPKIDPGWQDLTLLEWHARKGFEQRFVIGELPADGRTLRIREFPIRLNSLFDVRGSDRIQHFTLAVRIELSAQDLRKPLALYLAWIGEAWELYVNGERIENHLELRPDGTLARHAAYRGRVISLPPGALHEGENRIVLRLAGHGSLSGILANDDVGLFYREPYVLGDAREIYEAFDDAASLALCSAYAFFSLLLAVLYFRFGDVSMIWGSLVFLSLATEGFMKTGYVYQIIADTDPVARIKFAAQACALLCATRFHRAYLGDGVLFLILNAYAAIFILGFLLIPYGLLNPLVALFHISLPIAIVLGFTRVLLSAKKHGGLVFELLSIAVLATGVLLDIADDLFFRSGVRFTLPGGMLGYFLVIVFSRWHRGSPLIPKGDAAPAEKYRKSKTSRVDVQSTLKRLEVLMRQDRLYCDEDLTLAEQLNLSAYQLSEILNKERGTNFATFINEYRVDEARRLLKEEPDRSILSIGIAVGFNSRSRFNEVFKTITGETPSQFRNSR